MCCRWHQCCKYDRKKTEDVFMNQKCSKPRSNGRVLVISQPDSIHTESLLVRLGKETQILNYFYTPLTPSRFDKNCLRFVMH